MFTRSLRFLRKWKPAIATSLLTLGYGLKKVSFDNEIPPAMENPLAKTIQKTKLLKKMIEMDVCDSKSIREGELYFVDITDQSQNQATPRTYKVAISRVKGKLYAVLAHCTYKEPLTGQTVDTNSFEDAIIFNEKLYCPHHGCAFDIRTGSVEYGPARENLPRFFVNQIQGKVKLSYPTAIPISVTPKYQLRDMNDLRKIVVLGGDHSATMGVIDGFKQYEYGGEITVISDDEELDYPYRQELLHKNLLNLNKNLKKPKAWSSKQIEKELQEKIYSKLRFFNDQWYQAYGVNFIFNPQSYRIVNKRFYPYIKFMENTKVEFDGLIFATGFRPKFSILDNIVPSDAVPQRKTTNLPTNVFAPFYNKKQHRRLEKYLNGNDVKNMVVLGLNVQSLEFVDAVRKQFPDISVKVMDINNENTMTEIYGPDIANSILQEYVKNGVQFYLKIQYLPRFLNTLNNSITSSEEAAVPNYKNSITVKLDKNNSFFADCLVLFPNNSEANTELIKTAKFVDIDYRSENQRVIVNTHGRTDTKRMFAAGSCASQEFFFNRSKIEVLNPNVAYEQGLTAAFNSNALNVPFHYIPFEAHTFMGKKIYYAGARETFNEMYILGDVDTWDFVAFYGLQDDIIAVSASPSRQKQFQVIREAFRLQCHPRLQQIVKGQWKIPQIYSLIRKLNKSGCYKDLIRTLHPEMNIPDVIWMDRENGSFVSEEDDDDRNIEVDARGYQTQSH